MSRERWAVWEQEGRKGLLERAEDQVQKLLANSPAEHLSGTQKEKLAQIEKRWLERIEVKIRSRWVSRLEYKVIDQPDILEIYGHRQQSRPVNDLYGLKIGDRANLHIINPGQGFTGNHIRNDFT